MCLQIKQQEDAEVSHCMPTKVQWLQEGSSSMKRLKKQTEAMRHDMLGNLKNRELAGKCKEKADTV